MPSCPADLTFGLTFSQSHFESLQLESSRNVLEEASDFEGKLQMAQLLININSLSFPL